MTLHILNRTCANTLANLNQSLRAEDAILLLSDGVYLQAQLADLALHNSQAIYARDKDIQQRGLTLMNEKIQRIDDQQWVDLTLTHSPIVHW